MLAHLGNARGILQADAYKGYAKLYEPVVGGEPRFREAACFAHWRRDFHDIWTSQKSEIAHEALERIGQLYGIEREIAGKPADTSVSTLDYVATMLGEDVELLEAIASNDNNLTYGNILSVYTSPDEAITALTDRGIGELSDMLSDARRTTKAWHDFIDAFVDDPELAARFKAQSLR